MRKIIVSLLLIALIAGCIEQPTGQIIAGYRDVSIPDIEKNPLQFDQVKVRITGKYLSGVNAPSSDTPYVLEDQGYNIELRNLPDGNYVDYNEYEVTGTVVVVGEFCQCERRHYDEFKGEWSNWYQQTYGNPRSVEWCVDRTEKQGGETVQVQQRCIEGTKFYKNYINVESIVKR
ncbi:MAG: hypothetical protein ACE5J4_03585 [Candidatus Aenigmatarchaeota archaeon]